MSSHCGGARWCCCMERSGEGTVFAFAMYVTDRWGTEIVLMYYA